MWLFERVNAFIRTNKWSIQKRISVSQMIQSVHLCRRERYTTKLLIRLMCWLAVRYTSWLTHTVILTQTAGGAHTSWSEQAKLFLKIQYFLRSPLSCLTTTIHSLFWFLLRLWEALRWPWCIWFWGSIVHRWQIQRSVHISEYFTIFSMGLWPTFGFSVAKRKSSAAQKFFEASTSNYVGGNWIVSTRERRPPTKTFVVYQRKGCYSHIHTA